MLITTTTKSSEVSQKTTEKNEKEAFQNETTYLKNEIKNLEKEHSTKVTFLQEKNIYKKKFEQWFKKQRRGLTAADPNERCNQIYLKKPW